MCKSLRTVSGREQEPHELGLIINKLSQCHFHHFLKSSFGLFPLEPFFCVCRNLKKENKMKHFPIICLDDAANLVISKFLSVTVINGHYHHSPPYTLEPILESILSFTPTTFLKLLS